MEKPMDLFEGWPAAEAAKEMINHSNPNFRIYCMGWIGTYPDFTGMEVTGAVFREAKRGKNKGKLCIKVPKTTITTFVSNKVLEERKLTHPEEN